MKTFKVEAGIRRLSDDARKACMSQRLSDKSKSTTTGTTSTPTSR
jgi:hypothetical protein